LFTNLSKKKRKGDKEHLEMTFGGIPEGNEDRY
jgi:hypothetical protein